MEKAMNVAIDNFLTLGTWNWVSLVEACADANLRRVQALCDRIFSY
jgi:hypothetical protein